MECIDELDPFTEDAWTEVTTDVCAEVLGALAVEECIEELGVVAEPWPDVSAALLDDACVEAAIEVCTELADALTEELRVEDPAFLVDEACTEVAIEVCAELWELTIEECPPALEALAEDK